MAAPTPPSRTVARPDHLLVVDDEPTVRELLRTALRYAGFDVDAAATGREALDLAARHTPISSCSTSCSPTWTASR